MGKSAFECAGHGPADVKQRRSADFSPFCSRNEREDGVQFSGIRVFEDERTTAIGSVQSSQHTMDRFFSNRPVKELGKVFDG